MRDHNDPTSPLDDLAHGQSADAPRTVDAVLGQAVAVLRAFGTDDTHLTVDELVGRSGLTFGVVGEIVQALVTTRLLEPTGTSYRLSTLLFELGMRASAERGLIEVATPFLEDLYERTRETVHLGVREISTSCISPRSAGTVSPRFRRGSVKGCRCIARRSER